MTGPPHAADDGLPVLPGFREMARRRGHLLEALVARRMAAGLTQTEVAARMGTSQSSVARLESGAVDARLSTLERYAEVVGARIWGGPADAGPAAQHSPEEDR